MHGLILEPVLGGRLVLAVVLLIRMGHIQVEADEGDEGERERARMRRPFIISVWKMTRTRSCGRG